MKEQDPPLFFSEWLKRRRKGLDLTQAELAECAGCSVFAVRKIESGDRRPSKQLAGLLADCLNIPPEEQETFVRVARGELQVDRLDASFLEVAAGAKPHLEPTVPPTNLPASPTPLVGREPELAALDGLMGDPQCRMLTLLGPGGIGKTRLAIESATRNQERFRDGTYFVSLASLNSSAFLVPAIADALGFTFQGQIEPRLQLLNYLQAKGALLVLDNVEHLLDGVGLFSEMLERAPKVNLLVTSRERLNLQGEWVFEVQGLPVPPSDRVEGALEYSAVALFVQSGRRAKVDFELTTGEQSSVVRICQIMEGMPLGIELAAAWVSVLTCREIEQEIERSLDFLTTSMRDVPERQRSLRAAFEHSWNLLSTDERTALGRFAIFQGGFEREAAEQVACATLPTLLALASKSLVHRSESGRFDLHEVIRQYALSYFADDPQADSIRDRHSEYYLVMLKDREQDLKGAAQGAAVRKLTDELDNVRAAWTWAVKRKLFPAIGRSLRSFGWLYEIGGWFLEGIEELELVVGALRGRTEDEEWQAALGLALTQQGLLSFRKGLFNQAMSLFDESLAVLRPIGKPALLADPLVISGVIKHLHGQIEESKSRLVEGQACAQEAGDRWMEAYALFNLGYVASLLGHLEKGYEQMLAGLAIWREVGDPRSIALGLNFISSTTIGLGYYEKARAYLEESIALCTQADYRWGMGTAYRYLGLAELAQGYIPEARSHIQKSLDIFAGFVTGWDIVQSNIYLAEAAMAAGDWSEARQIYLKSLPQAMEIYTTPLVLDILIGLADLDARSGELQRALELSIFVMNHTASTQKTRDRAGQLAAEAETQLASHQIQAIRERTRNQSLELILAGILDEDIVFTGH